MKLDLGKIVSAVLGVLMLLVSYVWVTHVQAADQRFRMLEEVLEKQRETDAVRDETQKMTIEILNRMTQPTLPTLVPTPAPTPQ